MRKVVAYGTKLTEVKKRSNEEIRREQRKQLRNDIIEFAINNRDVGDSLIDDTLTWFASDDGVVYEFKFVETLGRRFMRVTVSDSEGSSNFNFTDDQWTTIKRFIIAKIK